MKLTVDSRQWKTGWELKQLGEVCNISTGKLNANAAVENGEYPFFTCSRETFTIDCFAFDCEAILLAGNNAVGDFNVKHYKGKFNAYQRTYVITINKKELLLYKYLYLQVENALKDFKMKSVGAGTKFLKLDMIKNLKIHLPPIIEQKRIVVILDEAFEGIDRAIALAEKSLANARELFESYLNAIFTQKGDGWEEKKIEDIALLSRGQNPPKSEFINSPQEGYVRFYQIRDGKNDNYEVYVPDTPQLHKVEPDDILMVAYRHIGRVFRGASGAFNVALCKIKNKDRSVLHDDYLFHIIPTDFVRGELMKQAERSLIPSMSVKHLAEIRIPIPPINEQNILIGKINDIQNKTQRLEVIYLKKITALNELKQSILQKAFTGELTADTLKTAKEVTAA